VCLPAFLIAGICNHYRGWIVKQALAAWIDQEEERHQLTLEALTQVDAGQVIGHQSVRA
jgi:predicted transcriptional regulator